MESAARLLLRPVFRSVDPQQVQRHCILSPENRLESDAAVRALTTARHLAISNNRRVGDIHECRWQLTDGD
jgi:hypothetical protein